MKILHLHAREMEHITYSNDQPNIYLVVQEIKYSVSSYANLTFLIPDNFKQGDDPPDKFLVFFNDIKEAEAAVRYLHSQLPPPLWEKIKWFHLTMTSWYHEEEFDMFKTSELWGLCVTNAFGMVSSFRKGYASNSYLAGSGPPWCRSCHPVEIEVYYVHSLTANWSSSAQGQRGRDYSCFGGEDRL